MPAVLLSAGLLDGCTSPESRPLSFEPPAESSWKISQAGASLTDGLAGGSSHADSLSAPAETGQTQGLTTLSMQGCSLSDRFDRSSTLAYNFSDGQSRMEFNVDAKGPSLADPGRLEFRGVGLRFSYKFQKIASHKDGCRFNSHYQGLLGSTFNELNLRQTDTVFQELHAKGLDFWN